MPRKKPVLFEAAVVRRDALGQFAVIQHASPQAMKAAYGKALPARSWISRFLFRSQ